MRLASRDGVFLCPSAMNYVLQSLLIAGFLLIEVLIGGTRLLFSLPTYCLLGAAACVGILALRRPVMPARASCLVGIAVFAGYLLLRIAFSPVEYLARPDLYQIAGSLTVYLLVALVLTAPKHRIPFLYALLALTVVQVLIGVVQFTRGENYMPFEFLYLNRADYGVRASGLYVCPNHLAGLLEVVALFAVSMVCWSRRSVAMKVVFGYVGLVAFAGQVITGSRGGYFSILGGLVAFVVLSLIAARRAQAQRLWLRILVGAAVVALLGAGVAWFVGQQPAVKNRMSGMLEMRNARLLAWAAAWEQTKLSPVVGTGAGSYLYYGRKYRDPSFTHDFVYVHNDYLHLLAEYGAIGVAAFLLFLIVHLRAGWRTFRWQISERALDLGRLQSDTLALNIGALCAVATYIIHSVVDFNLHIPGNALLMGFVFAILANPGARLLDEDRISGVVSRVGLYALPVLGVFMLISGGRLLPGEFYAEKARIALGLEEPFHAIRYAELGIQREEKNPDLWFYMGDAASQIARRAVTARTRGEYRDLAKHALGEALERFPQDQHIMLLLAYVLDEDGDYEGSEALYRRALEWDPNSSKVQRYQQEHQKRWEDLRQDL